jgi:23S rRNA maturation-related 3'-5' exoribonuclease YhaM
MIPHKKVSPEKYKQPAKIKWRVKGNTDGHVYQGQEIIAPCKTCGTNLTLEKPNGKIHP